MAGYKDGNPFAPEAVKARIAAHNATAAGRRASNEPKVAKSAPPAPRGGKLPPGSAVGGDAATKQRSAPSKVTRGASPSKATGSARQSSTSGRGRTTQRGVAEYAAPSKKGTRDPGGRRTPAKTTSPTPKARPARTAKSGAGSKPASRKATDWNNLDAWPATAASKAAAGSKGGQVTASKTKSRRKPFAGKKAIRSGSDR